MTASSARLDRAQPSRLSTLRSSARNSVMLRRSHCIPVFVELIRFNGDGSLDVPGATRSLNGVITQVPGGDTGSYTLTTLVPDDRGCVGTLTFLPSGPHFDLFLPLDGKEIWMIQTDAGNVFQGTVTKLAN